MWHRLFCFSLTFLALSPAALCAATLDVDSPYHLNEESSRARSEASAFWSLLLPGFGQWQEHQYAYAALYSGVAAGGLGYGIPSLISPSGPKFGGVDRDAAVGFQMYQVAGELSAFHAFRTSALSQQSLGHYNFLPANETPADLMLAPFRFDFLLRPTTLVPLAAIAALFYYVIPRIDPNPPLIWNRLSTSDVAFLSATSYMAGTGEEALFRGTLMPYLNDQWKNPLLSNLATAGIFALAHVDISPGNFFIPWPQFLGGVYFGWVSQFRSWTLAESIFLHTWYDVIVFSASYAASSDRNHIFIPLPSINFRF